jgi:heme-degrading monooxygenase HmoA
MIAVIFELWPAKDRAEDYFSLAAALKARLDKIDGFISVERFASLSEEGKFVSISFWRDEEAVRRWRGDAEHRLAQTAGRNGIFRNYRLRVASVLRDYGLTDRSGAPSPESAQL